MPFLSSLLLDMFLSTTVFLLPFFKFENFYSFSKVDSIWHLT